MGKVWDQLLASARDVVDHGSRESMVRWLQTEDPNGCYDDDCTRRELGHRMTKANARAAICEILVSSFSTRDGDRANNIPRYCWKRFFPRIPARAGLRGCSCRRKP
jgi:hypothetical protein